MLSTLHCAIIATAVSLLCPSASASLIHYWDFNEAPGYIAYDSAGTLNGTMGGLAHMTPTGGVEGGAVTIAAGLVNMGADDPQINFNSTSSFTLQAWIKMAVGDLGNYYVVSHSYIGFTNGYYFAVGNVGDMCPGSLPGTVHFFSGYPCTPGSSILVNDGQWHQVIGTYDRGVASLYVDGLMQGSSSGITLTPFPDLPFLVGGMAIGGVPFADFNGQVDDVAIWNNALTAQQISGANSIGGDPPSTPEPATMIVTGIALLAIGSIHRYRSGPRV